VHACPNRLGGFLRLPTSRFAGRRIDALNQRGFAQRWLNESQLETAARLSADPGFHRNGVSGLSTSFAAVQPIQAEPRAIGACEKRQRTLALTSRGLTRRSSGRFAVGASRLPCRAAQLNR
jgi:hypothetical protein